MEGDESGGEVRDGKWGVPLSGHKSAFIATIKTGSEPCSRSHFFIPRLLGPSPSSLPPPLPLPTLTGPLSSAAPPTTPTASRLPHTLPTPGPPHPPYATLVGDPASSQPYAFLFWPRFHLCVHCAVCAQRRVKAGEGLKVTYTDATLGRKTEDEPCACLWEGKGRERRQWEVEGRGRGGSSDTGLVPGWAALTGGVGLSGAEVGGGGGEGGRRAGRKSGVLMGSRSPPSPRSLLSRPR